MTDINFSNDPIKYILHHKLPHSGFIFDQISPQSVCVHGSSPSYDLYPFRIEVPPRVLS